MFILYVLILKVEKKRKTKGVRIFFCSIKIVFPMPGLFNPNGIVLSFFTGNRFAWFFWHGKGYLYSLNKPEIPLFLLLNFNN